MSPCGVWWIFVRLLHQSSVSASIPGPGCQGKPYTTKADHITLLLITCHIYPFLLDLKPMLPLVTWFPEPLGPPLLPLFPGSLCSRPTGLLPAPWAPQAWFGLRAFTLPVPSASNALRHLCGFPSHLPWLFVHMSTRWCGQWTGAWANSGRWWRTGNPGMLQSTGSQRVGRNLATEGQQQVGEAYFKLKPTAQSRFPSPAFSVEHSSPITTVCSMCT